MATAPQFLKDTRLDLIENSGRKSHTASKTTSLKFRATMVAIALSTLPVFIIGSIAYILASDVIVQQITTDHHRRNAIAGSQINNFLVSRLRDLEVLALNPILTGSTPVEAPDQYQIEVNNFFHTLEYFDSIVLFDISGAPIAQTNIGNPFTSNYSDRAYFQAAIATGKPTMNGPGLSKSTGKLRVEFAVPVKDPYTREIRFILRGRIPGKHINQLFTTLEEQGQGWYLVNETGTIFAGSNLEHLSRSVHTHFPSASNFVRRYKAGSGIFLAHKQHSHNQQTETDKTNAGITKAVRTGRFSHSEEVVSYVPVTLSAELPERKIGLITYRSTLYSLATKQRLSVTFAIGTALTGLIAASIALLLVKRINDPIHQLTEIARTISQEGRFDLRAPVMSDDEIGSLATSFNQLIECVSLRTQALETSQADLEQRTQELSAVIHSLGDGLLVIDPTGRIMRFNPPLLKMFDQSSDVLYQQLASHVFSQDMTRLIAQSQTDPGQAFTAEISLAGNRVGQALINTMLDADTQTPMGCVMLIRDITEEKEIDRMKTDFISTVSHELRTPLTSILGFAKIIQKKLVKTVLPTVACSDQKTQKATRQVKENLGIIVSEGERLTSLINDLLDIAKIESGKVDWDMEEISPEQVVHQAMATTSVLAQKANITLLTEIPPNLSVITADQDRLVQVIINLISNAIKFTQRGTVTCEIKETEDEVRISVIDTGIGISKADQSKVFEKFQQIGAIMTDKPQGTGLGLPICKQIVEHHGGRIWVESQLDIGSTFSVALPLTKTALMNTTSTAATDWMGTAEPITQHDTVATLVKQLKVNIKQTTDTQQGNTKTILVVDDESNIRELLRQELEAEGYQVKEAMDGLAALNLAKRDKPDLIITDIKMPKLDGFDLTAVLKTNPITANIPTIMLSIVEDSDRGLKLGVDRYLSKPIDISTLLKNVETLITHSSRLSKVLVVNQDSSASKTLTEFLLSKGYVVAEAHTEQEGLNKIRTIKPNTVILDTTLCKNNTIVNAIQSERGLENISIILTEDFAESALSADLSQMTMRSPPPPQVQS